METPLQREAAGGYNALRITGAASMLSSQTGDCLRGEDWSLLDSPETREDTQEDKHSSSLTVNIFWCLGSSMTINLLSWTKEDM